MPSKSNCSKSSHTRRRSTGRRGSRGGNAVLRAAAVPFGLFALSNYLGSVKKHRATHKGKHGKRSRRVSMRKKK